MDGICARVGLLFSRGRMVSQDEVPSICSSETSLEQIEAIILKTDYGGNEYRSERRCNS